jgi:hypothetical protein
LFTASDVLASLALHARELSLNAAGAGEPRGGRTMAGLKFGEDGLARRRMGHVLRQVSPSLAAATLVLVAACSQHAARPPATAPSPSAGPPPGDTSSRMHVDPALQSFVDRAVADLARRRDADPAEITVLEASAVVWPDGSLGCPRPGMEYTQVMHEGVRIRLQLGGRTYAYHGGGSRMPELCEHPTAPPV